MNDCIIDVILMGPWATHTLWTFELNCWIEFAISISIFEVTAESKDYINKLHAKRAHYHSLNAIYGKVGRFTSEEVPSKCLPILHCGLEACLPKVNEESQMFAHQTLLSIAFWLNYFKQTTTMLKMTAFHTSTLLLRVPYWPTWFQPKIRQYIAINCYATQIISYSL